ncbi:MAG: alpha-methylacyl-CoA racemase [Aeromicrobium sp.]|nr:alpha-methylacyl-CoA racemase [Aeromicrobium sp.]
MEKLGIGPEQCIGRNPSLVYGRMTGWGQTGPRARTAGHDISYIAVTGALDGSRRAGELPVPPMNLLGDLGGGSMYLLFGLMCALHHARVSGEGQVVDANIVDGTASLTNFIYGLKAQGMWSDIPGTNVLDTGAPFYDTYRCADGLEIAVGALEPQFYAQLLAICDVHIDDPLLSASVRDDPTTWPTARRRWTEIFASRTRADWIDAFAGSDACVAPILAWADAANDPHLTARGVIQEFQGATQAAPAPRFSATPGNLRTGPVAPGQHTDEVLAELGYDSMRIAAVRSAGAVG